MPFSFYVDWESLLRPSSQQDLFLPEDTEKLRSRQMTQINNALEEARANSLFKLDDFRNNEAIVEEFCKTLPRGGMSIPYL